MEYLTLSNICQKNLPVTRVSKTKLYQSFYVVDDIPTRILRDNWWIMRSVMEILVISIEYPGSSDCVSVPILFCT